MSGEVPVTKQRRTFTAKLVNLPDSLKGVKGPAPGAIKGGIRRARICMKDTMEQVNTLKEDPRIAERKDCSSCNFPSYQIRSSVQEGTPSAFNIIGRGKMPAIMFVNGKVVVVSEQ